MSPVADPETTMKPGDKIPAWIPEGDYILETRKRKSLVFMSENEPIWLILDEDPI